MFTELTYPDQSEYNKYNVDSLEQHLRLFFQRYPDSLTKQILKALEEFYAHPNISKIEARKALSKRQVIGIVAVSYMATNSSQPPLICAMLMAYQLLTSFIKHLPEEEANQQKLKLVIDIHNYYIGETDRRNAITFVEKSQLNKCKSILVGIESWMESVHTKEDNGIEKFKIQELDEHLQSFFATFNKRTQSTAISHMADFYDKTTIINNEKQAAPKMGVDDCAEYIAKEMEIPYLLANMIEVNQLFSVIGPTGENKKSHEPLVLATAGQLFVNSKNTKNREEMQQYIDKQEEKLKLSYEKLKNLYEEIDSFLLST